MIASAGRLLRSPVFGQLLRFGMVGGFVTALGAGAYLVAAYAGVHPLLANVLAYAVAVAAGYVLHSRVSFRDHGSRDQPGRRTARFVTVSLISLTMNSVFVWLLTGPAQLPLWTPVVPMLFLTPLVTFSLNRRWVFS